MAKFRDKILIYVDGASFDNPGHSGIGLVIFDDLDNELYCEGKYVGEKTNNEAEYMAVLEALNTAPAYCTHHISIHSDSQLVIKQLNRRFRVKAKNLLHFHKDVRNCEKIFKSVEYVQVPRENKRIQKADNLATAAIKEKLEGL